MRQLLPLLALPLLAGACTPTCDTTCRHLIDCEAVESIGMSQDQCAEDCAAQEYLIKEIWNDTQLLEQLYDARSCVVDSSCEDIAAGVCYDPDLYPY